MSVFIKGPFWTMAHGSFGSVYSSALAHRAWVVSGSAGGWLTLLHTLGSSAHFVFPSLKENVPSRRFIRHVSK